MAIDLDYMVKLKDGRVIEREMVRGELRNVMCKVVDEMNPTWSHNCTLNTAQTVHLILCAVGQMSLEMSYEHRSISTILRIS